MNEIAIPYEHLRDEVESLLTEMRFTMRWALIEWNHKLGETIRAHGTGDITKLLQTLAVDLRISERSLWNAVKVFDAYPNLDAIPGGKAISMNKLLKQLTSGKKEELCIHQNVETIILCKECGKRV